MIEIRKKEGETVGSFLFRFNKRIKHSGVLKEMRKRKNRRRVENDTKRHATALYRVEKQTAIQHERRYGNESSRKTR